LGDAPNLPTPDLVIKRVNQLGNDQPSVLVFTDRNGNPIGEQQIPGVDDAIEEVPVDDEPVDIPGVDLDNPVEIPGVDGEEAPQNVEIHDSDIAGPTPEPDPLLIVPETTPAAAVSSAKPASVATVQPRRSSRARNKPAKYIPSLKGQRYAYVATQLQEGQSPPSTCTIPVTKFDNRSSILLEKNGKQSSGKRTRHINIRFSFHYQ